MYLIKNNKRSILSSKLSILSNKLSIPSKKLISSSNRPSVSSNKLSIIVHAILVHAILVQRYSCAPNILYYIKYSNYFHAIVVPSTVSYGVFAAGST